MIKALAIKELRESLGITVVAALAMVLVVWLQISYLSSANNVGIPFVMDTFSSISVVIAGAMSIALGLKQTALEAHHGTFHFLLFRPALRRRIMLTKLAVGMFLVLALLTLSILTYGIWAATPGNWAGPFDWSMSLNLWMLTASLPLVYLGSFMSGIRPGKWFGTRLVPLAGAVIVVAIIAASSVWWIQWPLTAIGYFGCWIAIDHCAEIRDY